MLTCVNLLNREDIIILGDYLREIKIWRNLLEELSAQLKELKLKIAKLEYKIKNENKELRKTDSLRIKKTIINEYRTLMNRNLHFCIIF